jgi:hypothetical protein
VPQAKNHDGRFQAGPHPARPIGRGGSNQRESLASPDSPSHCASLATTPLSPVGCACGEKRQYHRNRSWGKIGGGKWGIVGIIGHYIPRPYRQLNPVPGKPNITSRNEDDGSPRQRVMLHLSLDDGLDEVGKPLVRDCSCRGDTAGFAHLSCTIWVCPSEEQTGGRTQT